jgi:predicted GNAT family N-acyltransferase
MVTPPGPSIAPNGFPVDALPSGAPQPFLDTMAVRMAVFCDEQRCSVENELDEDDHRSWSWNIYNASSLPVATVRLVPPPHPTHPNGYHDPNEEPYIKLTRFATIAQERGKGLGKILLQMALDWASTHAQGIFTGWNGMVLLHAQTSVEKMYAKMGFVTDDKLGRWNEEGIEHVGMWKRIPVVATAVNEDLTSDSPAEQAKSRLS